MHLPWRQGRDGKTEEVRAMEINSIHFLLSLTDREMKKNITEENYEASKIYLETLQGLCAMLPDREKEKVPESIKATLTDTGLKRWLKMERDEVRKMNVVEAAKFLPEGKTHIIEPLTNKELAIWVETLFLKESKCDCKGEKETAEQILLRKEIAYQVIQRLTENEEVKENLIRSEKDWRRYLQIERQDYHK